MNDLNSHLIPAIDIPLTGQHLIEASAGTGKTWTLTGILLRLLIEKGHTCEKIITTTFTRSASSEMQQRIQERLQNLLQLIRLSINTLDKLSVTSDQQTLTEKVDVFWETLQQQAQQTPLLDLVTDKVNEYLIKWLAEQTFSNNIDNEKTKENQQKHANINFSIAEYRTLTAINQLDKLFIGTLDSLCQKWLREFSTDTGYQTDVQISDNVDYIITNMIHDQLRAYRYTLHQQYPDLYQLMYSNKQLPTVENCLNPVKKALNFYSASIDKVQLRPVNLTNIKQLINKINQTDDSEFIKYTNLEFRTQQKLHKSRAKFLEEWLYLKPILQKNDLNSLFSLTKPQENFLTKIYEYFYIYKYSDDEQKNSFFNKNSEENQQQFSNIILIKKLAELEDLKRKLTQYIDDLNNQCHQYICQYIRQQLPLVLENQQKTTFSLQLARLNQALQGEHGKALARHIRYHYPVALIDESQDINTEQAQLIQQIYLNHHQENPTDKPSHQFLLLVGDPKQAIYGFRGGDVQNYTLLKKQFKNQSLALIENFRSSSQLIDGLNHWFGVPDKNSIDNQKFDEKTPKNKLPCYLGDNIYYQHIVASRDSTDLTIQLTDSLAKNDNQQPAIFLLNIAYQQPRPMLNPAENIDDIIDYSDVVTAQILALLNNKKQTYFYQNRKLTCQDIGVLADKHKQLDEIERKLSQHQIPTIRGGSKSIFADSMSHDLLLLMQALLSPYHLDKIKRLLLTNFFQLDLQKTNQFINSNNENNQFSKLQELLHDTGKNWQKFGFLSAIQILLNYQFILPNETSQINFWQRLARHRDGERLLVDLRQLLDIISQFTHGLGEYQLLEWLAKHISEQTKDDWAIQQRLASDDGVQLMTIHQSKGLEFPIVFVVGLDKDINSKNNKDKFNLYLYTDNQLNQKNLLSNRRLSPVKYRGSELDFYQNLDNDAQYEEKLRLTYVALTRAKERLYIIAQSKRPLKSQKNQSDSNNNNNNKVALAHWLGDRDYAVPEDLADKICQVDINTLGEYLQKDFLYDLNQETDESSVNDSQIFDDTMYLKTKFQGWSNTSFTALSHHLSHEKQKVAVDEPEYDNFVNDKLLFESLENNTENLAEKQLLRFQFEKGANAGTFLHKVLESLAGIHVSLDNWQDNPMWSFTIDKIIKEYQLPDYYLSKDPTATDNVQSKFMELSAWLLDILQTPFLASKQSLLKLPKNQKVAELGFNMSIRDDLTLESINQLFMTENIHLNLHNNYQNFHHWRYLRGEIDLVYQHDNKFYVVDYKSNFLGNQFHCYQESQLIQAMNEHGYWLQAGIYQVALHRYLQMRLENYDIYQHLGAVEYAFLRGMSKNNHYGRLVWQPNPEFILKLDKLFGTAQ